MENLDDESVDMVCAVCGKAPWVAPAIKDDMADYGPNKDAGNSAGAQVSLACKLCEECEEYYAVMYTEPSTQGATWRPTCPKI